MNAPTSNLGPIGGGLLNHPMTMTPAHNTRPILLAQEAQQVSDETLDQLTITEATRRAADEMNAEMHRNMIVDRDAGITIRMTDLERADMHRVIRRDRILGDRIIERHATSPYAQYVQGATPTVQDSVNQINAVLGQVGVPDDFRISDPPQQSTAAEVEAAHVESTRRHTEAAQAAMDMLRASLAATNTQIPAATRTAEELQAIYGQATPPLDGLTTETARYQEYVRQMLSVPQPRRLVDYINGTRIDREAFEAAQASIVSGLSAGNSENAVRQLVHDASEAGRMSDEQVQEWLTETHRQLGRTTGSDNPYQRLLHDRAAILERILQQRSRGPEYPQAQHANPSLEYWVNLVENSRGIWPLCSECQKPVERITVVNPPGTTAPLTCLFVCHDMGSTRRVNASVVQLCLSNSTRLPDVQMPPRKPKVREVVPFGTHHRTLSI